MTWAASYSENERAGIAAWIGERPGTVLPVAALLMGVGRLWVAGRPAEPDAVLVESPLVPGEPQAFGNPSAIAELLGRADGWSCVEVESALAEDLEVDFDRRWGLHRVVTDVVHRLDEPVQLRDHALVGEVAVGDLRDLELAEQDMLPADWAVVEHAASAGWLFGAVSTGVLVGRSAALATGGTYADVGVHVAAKYRRQGIASAAASQVCRAVQRAGLIPVWGTGAGNTASLALARSLGFVEVERLTFLVRRST